MLLPMSKQAKKFPPSYFTDMQDVLKTKPMRIEKIVFDKPGIITLKLDDGRVFMTPLRYFPELLKLPLPKRKQCTIVDDRIILFRHSDIIYHLEDFIGLEEKWRER
jgi:hypothetical protein